MIAGGDALLVAERLRCRYGARLVVDDVSLSVPAGHIVGLLGPNGAGKTTSFHAIAGLVPLEGGRIRLGGHELGPLPLYRRARLGLGYLPQEPTVFRRLTARQNLMVVLESRGGGRRQHAEAARRALAAAGLEHVAEVAGESLSGGERRRLELARALCCQPKVLLLDEPFAGVDPIAVGELKARLRAIADTGIGVLVTDHNVAETLKACDHAYLMYAGRLLKAGRPEDIVADARVREVYLGTDFQL